MQPLTVSHGTWGEGEEKGAPVSTGQTGPSPYSLHPALAVSGLGSGSSYAGAGGEVTGSGESLTLVVVGSDDLGLLRVLFLHQVSCRNKTEGAAVATGTVVEFVWAEQGAVCVCKKGGLVGIEFSPGLA